MAHGNGTTGTTTETMLQFGLYFGSGILGIAPVIGTTAMDHQHRVPLVRHALEPDPERVPAPPPGWVGSITGTVSALHRRQLVPANTSNFTILFAGGTSGSPVTVDATAAQPFSLRCQWGATTGEPTITCIKTRFTRCG